MPGIPSTSSKPLWCTTWRRAASAMFESGCTWSTCLSVSGSRHQTSFLLPTTSRRFSQGFSSAAYFIPTTVKLGIAGLAGDPRTLFFHCRHLYSSLQSSSFLFSLPREAFLTNQVSINANCIAELNVISCASYRTSSILAAQQSYYDYYVKSSDENNMQCVYESDASVRVNERHPEAAWGRTG